MATLTTTELLDWLAQQQFLTQAQTDELRPLISGFADTHALAKVLILRNWLTPFQVNQILQGKHDQLVLGGYRLRERVGEGAMGQIFKAWHFRLGRIVAVKTIHKEFVSSPKAMDRFRREIETAAQLDHPNIVLVRDADNIDGRPFMVMDYIDGGNLSVHVKTHGALPIHVAVEYARQTAVGLQYAHEHGIVHRDIKPSNLLLTTTKVNGAPTPLVKILDFGLARFESESDNTQRLTQIGNLLGTVDYVAPEQAQNARTADIRADIYSLGCTLYYLLTARPPFLGENVVEKIGPRLMGEPPSVRAVRPEVPEELDALLRKLMARRPDERLQTPIEVAQALEPFAAVEDFSPPVPVAQAAVVMAQPVAADAVAAGAVPMAMPITAAPVEPTPAEEPAFQDMTATGRDMSTGSAAATPSMQKPSKPLPVKLVALVSGGLVLCFVACMAICMFSNFAGPPEKKDHGAIRIKEVKFSTPSQTVKAGERKAVLVFIDRTNCRMPLKLTLLDCPDDVRPNQGSIAGNSTKGDVIFTVRAGTAPMEAPIRVVAESDKGEVRAEATLLLKVVK